MTDIDFFQLVRSGWSQIAAIFGIIWWSRKIDLRTKGHTGRIDRHEERLRSLERALHAHAVEFARTQEMLSGIKLTLDRIYSEMRETGR